MTYSRLFSPMKIGNCEIKNRLVMAPMHMGFGDFDGKVTDKLLNYYEERAKGGTGLIVTEITRINDKTGPGAFSQLAASRDYHIDSLRLLAERIHKHGAKLFVQLHHPGRQNVGLLVGTIPLCIKMNRLAPKAFKKVLYKIAPTVGKSLVRKKIVPASVAPSKTPPSYFSGGRVRALRYSEIKALIKGFISGAERVMKAGCDGVMLHAAHGYLIQQFLSPYTNFRTDEYGGSLENRMRFLLEIIEGIKEKCPGFPLTVRLSVDECYEKIGFPDRGYTLEEGVKMAEILEKAGIDAIDVSSASYDTFNYWLEPTTFAPGWRKYMAKAVKEKVSIPVIAANLIRSPAQAEAQLRDGIQDFISLGRPHIADPHWANKAMAGKDNEIRRCISCLYCFESMQNNAYLGTHGRCSVNPFVGKETETIDVDGKGRDVVVVGGGPAGLTAAILLAKRGFKVTLFEKENWVGGQVSLAANSQSKSRLNWCIDDLHSEAERLKIKIQYGVAATVKLIHMCQPYAVFVATGGTPIIPKAIEGSSDPMVAPSTDVFKNYVRLSNSHVAVIGSGLTGLDTAVMLAEQGNKISIIEMQDTIAPGMWMQHVDDAMLKLKQYDVSYYTSERLVKIENGAITTQNTKSKKSTVLKVDKVILAMGVKPEKGLYFDLKSLYKHLYVIGDAKKSGRIYNATTDAYNAVRALPAPASEQASPITEKENSEMSMRY